MSQIFFPTLVPAFSSVKWERTLSALPEDPSEFRDTAVNFATCKELGEALLR